MSDAGDRSRSGPRSPSTTLSAAGARPGALPVLATDDVETRPRRRASTRDAVPGSHRDSAPALDAATPTRGRSAARARGGSIVAIQFLSI